MPLTFYNWLGERLKVSRPPLMTYSQENTSSSHDFGIRLDRLHCERILKTNTDDSIIVLQILHGILKDEPFVNDKTRGLPRAAVRYCHSHTLDRLVKVSLYFSVFFDSNNLL